MSHTGVHCPPLGQTKQAVVAEPRAHFAHALLHGTHARQRNGTQDLRQPWHVRLRHVHGECVVVQPALELLLHAVLPPHTDRVESKKVRAIDASFAGRGPFPDDVGPSLAFICSSHEERLFTFQRRAPFSLPREREEPRARMLPTHAPG